MRRDEEGYKDTGDTEGYKGIHTKGYIQRNTKMRHRSWYLANESPYTVPAEEGE